MSKEFSQKDIDVYEQVCKELQGDISDEEMEEIEEYMEYWIGK